MSSSPSTTLRCSAREDDHDDLAQSVADGCTTFAVDSIPVTFWRCLIWERWPVGRLKSRLGTAASLILACYGVNYGIWELVVGTGWMAGPTLDAVSVSAVALMFLMLQFELWPLTRLGAMDHQPTRGAIWTLAVVGGGIGLAFIGTGRSCPH